MGKITLRENGASSSNRNGSGWKPDRSFVKKPSPFQTVTRHLGLIESRFALVQFHGLRYMNDPQSGSVKTAQLTGGIDLVRRALPIAKYFPARPTELNPHSAIVRIISASE